MPEHVAVDEAGVDRHQLLDRVDDPQQVEPQVEHERQPGDARARHAEDDDLPGRDLDARRRGRAPAGCPRRRTTATTRAARARPGACRSSGKRRSAAVTSARVMRRRDREQHVAGRAGPDRGGQRFGVGPPVDADDAADAIQREAERQLDGGREGDPQDGQEGGVAVGCCSRMAAASTDAGRAAGGAPARTSLPAASATIRAASARWGPPRADRPTPRCSTWPERADDHRRKQGAVGQL